MTQEQQDIAEALRHLWLTSGVRHNAVFEARFIEAVEAVALAMDGQPLDAVRAVVFGRG